MFARHRLLIASKYSALGQSLSARSMFVPAASQHTLTVRVGGSTVCR